MTEVPIVPPNKEPRGLDKAPRYFLTCSCGTVLEYEPNNGGFYHCEYCHGPLPRPELKWIWST